MDTIPKMFVIWQGVLFLLYKALELAGIKLPIEIKLPGKPAPQVVAPPPAVPVTRQQPGGITIFDRGQPVQAEPDFEPAYQSRTVTKCTQYSTVTFTDTICPPGATTTTVTVATGKVGTQAPQTTIREAPVQSVPAPVAQSREVVIIKQTPVQNQASAKQFECQALEQEIKEIDALARQAMSGQSQDSLSEHRKQVRSRQFALQC